MDKNNGKVKLNDELLDKVCGGESVDWAPGYRLMNTIICFYCGAELPEGTQVCEFCEEDPTGKDINYSDPYFSQ